MTGHCSQCDKVWTLEAKQGVCQWCGKQGTCQHQKRPSRSIETRQRKQVPSYDNHYDQLPEPQLTYYKVASHFNRKALIDDQEDLLQDIMVVLADVASHKPLTKPAMYRIASVTVADYWRAHYKLTNGLDCGNCSKAQRRKCKEGWLYGNCPKAIKLAYLSQPVADSEGNITELGELIADDHAIDLDQWLDAEAIILSLKPILIDIAHKVNDGQALSTKEQVYLWRYRKRTQKSLF